MNESVFLFNILVMFYFSGEHIKPILSIKMYIIKNITRYVIIKKIMFFSLVFYTPKNVFGETNIWLQHSNFCLAT